MVRGILLKGSGLSDLARDGAALFALMLLAMGIAVARFRQTLD